MSSLDRLLQRLMEAGGPVRSLFAVDPFNGALPIRMRIRTYALTDHARERAATRRYWHKDFVHEHAHERGPDATTWQRWLPASEQLHPDERWARRRVPRLLPLLSARDLDVVRAVLRPDAARMWETFWSAFMPRAREACASGWPAVDRLARDLRASMTAADLDCCDRIRGAVSTALLERIEPRVLGAATPVVDTATYFHASLLVHAAMLEGPEKVGAILRDPLQVQSLPGYEEAGLMLITLLRHGMMLEHARTHRMIGTMNMAPPPDSKAVPGFMHVQPVLARSLPDAEQRLPNLDCTADGEWRIDRVAFVDRRLPASPAVR